MVRVIKTEAEITNIVTEDEWMMRVLSAAEDLNLPDWWIGAGFLRNKIWDYLQGKPYEIPKDIDLVYFNKDDVSADTDHNFESYMHGKHPYANWEICNQARMHDIDSFSPFTSTSDGIAHWVETATCSAVRKQGDSLFYLFCYGTNDLFNLIARPTPYFTKKPLVDTFYRRVEEKRWQSRWPNLRILLS